MHLCVFHHIHIMNIVLVKSSVSYDKPCSVLYIKFRIFQALKKRWTYNQKDREHKVSQFWQLNSS